MSGRNSLIINPWYLCLALICYGKLLRTIIMGETWLEWSVMVLGSPSQRAARLDFWNRNIEINYLTSELMMRGTENTNRSLSSLSLSLSLSSEHLDQTSPNAHCEKHLREICNRSSYQSDLKFKLSKILLVTIISGISNIKCSLAVNIYQVPFTIYSIYSKYTFLINFTQINFNNEGLFRNILQRYILYQNNWQFF